MARKTKPADQCEFTGCKCKATTIAHKLWGKGGTIQTCDEHKPGSNPSPVAQKIIEKRGTPFYRLEPIGK